MATQSASYTLIVEIESQERPSNFGSIIGIQALLTISVFLFSNCQANISDNEEPFQRWKLSRDSVQVKQLESSPTIQNLLSSLRDSGWTHPLWDQATLTGSLEESEQAVQIPLEGASLKRVFIGIDLKDNTPFIKGVSRERLNQIMASVIGPHRENETSACPPPPYACMTCPPSWCVYQERLTLSAKCWEPCTVVGEPCNPFGYAFQMRSRSGYTSCTVHPTGTYGNPRWLTDRCGDTVACPEYETGTATMTVCPDFIEDIMC